MPTLTRRVFIASSAFALASAAHAQNRPSSGDSVETVSRAGGEGDAETSKRGTGKRAAMKIFYGLTNTLDEFRKLSEICARHHGTHVFISDLHKARWWWERTPDDPYPNWGMLSPSLFKTVPPDPIKPYIPQDWVEKNLTLIAQRSEILREFGLKAAFQGCEPGWLPGEVFEEYPEWRGPRYEKPRRARHAYYSPCIDNEEVLAMFRDSIRKLCAIAPIEYFTFLTNDSGAGICWSHGLYPGINGNTACEHIGFGERVSKFLTTVQDATNETASHAQVELAGSIPEHEIEQVIPYLRPGQSVNGMTSTREPLTHTVGYMASFYSCGLYPSYNVPQPINYIKDYARACAAKDSNTIICIDSLTEQFPVRLYVKCETSSPPKSLRDCEGLLYDFCRDEVGAEYADDLYEVFNHIIVAKECVIPVASGGPLFLLGAVNQRWLTRPFVAEPLKLTPEEKDYYRKYQFQANSEETAADMMDLQGMRLVGGHSAAYIVSNILNKGVGELQQAVARVDRIEKAISGSEKEEMRVLSMRIKALICIYRNAGNAIWFQDLMDRTDKENLPVEYPYKRVKGDQKLHEVINVVRAEIDNINELIELIEGCPKPVIWTAPSPEEEDVMQFSPELVPQLRKKIRIMLAHQMDFNKFYVRNN